MQHNKNIDNHDKNASSIRCKELPQQSSSTTYSTRTMSAQHFPPRYVNPRFSLTPDTMGLNVVRSENQANLKEYQQPAHEPPLVDVKSYNERYNIKRLVGNISDLKFETNTSYHSFKSNDPKTSYVSVKSENDAQRLTPQTPLSANNSTQQWYFGNIYRQQEQIEQPEQTTGISTATLNCSTQSIQPLASTVKYTSATANSPCDLQACISARKPSEDSCISICSTRSPSCSRQHSFSATELPTSYFEQQLKSFHTGSDIITADSAKINYGTLNNIFLKRLQDIDANACSDKELKLITFQEWVDVLLKINNSFIINMEELEKEVAERLELVQQKVNTKCRYSQGNELMKCRKDIETLVKILQNLYQNNYLDLSNITFETINPEQIFPQGEHFNTEGNGVMKTDNDSEVMQRNKLLANIKALAHEVAERHDEMRELKRQIICLEDDIQKAQQKIQFKDDVIKELRNDLKCANHKLSANNHQLEANLSMPPINLENVTSRSATTQITDCNTLADENNFQFDTLSHSEHEEQQKIKVLEEELNEFFEISREMNKQKMENQCKRLLAIFQTAEAEKVKARQKLDSICRQLINLESDNAERINDGNSGFHSKSESDQYVKIMDAVRQRFRKLNETNFELKKKVQRLELQNSELSTNLQSEKNFAQRSSQTLKEIADLLDSMTIKQFSYTDIYKEVSNEQNPFCEAINGIKKAFQEKEEQLLKVVCLKNKQIEDLSHEKQVNEARAENFNPSDLWEVSKTTITTAPSSLSSYTPSQPVSTVTFLTNTTTFKKSSSLTGQHLNSMTSTFHEGS